MRSQGRGNEAESKTYLQQHPLGRRTGTKGAVPQHCPPGTRLGKAFPASGMVLLPQTTHTPPGELPGGAWRDLIQPA